MKSLVLKATGGGGLGDCVKSVLTAAHYAKLSNRALYVDWSGGIYADKGQDPFYQFFKLVGVELLKKLPDSNDVHPPSWQRRLTRSLHDVYVEDGWKSWNRSQIIQFYSFDLARLDYPNEVLVMWDFDQLAKLTESSSIEVLRGLRKKYLRLSPSMFDQFKAVKDEIGTVGLAVHIRATNEFQQSKIGLSVSRYFLVVDSVLRETKDRLPIFLSTDNKNVEVEFCNRYPSTVVNNKWFAGAGEPLHLAPNRKDKLATLRSAMLDVLMLSNGQVILITPRSSFSELALIFAASNAQIRVPSRGLTDRVFNLLSKRLT